MLFVDKFCLRLKVIPLISFLGRHGSRNFASTKVVWHNFIRHAQGQMIE